MDKSDKSDKHAAMAYLFKIVIGRLLGLACYAVGAWWAMDARAWIYFAFCVVSSVVGGVFMTLKNPEAFAWRSGIGEDTPAWDRAIVTAFWLLSYFGIYLVAGLGAGEAVALGALFWTGMSLCLISAGMQLAAMAVNPFLETSARIQEDRGQTVISDGIYRMVRHPTYSAILLWCVGVCLVFPTLAVQPVSVTIAMLIVTRTSLEDRMLTDNLAGYREYSKATRWRLIPFVW